MSLTTLVVVDDHAAFLAAASALLDGDGFSVVGTASTAAAALLMIAEVHPDAVLLDVRLPDASGIDVARALSRLPSPPDVVLVSSLTEEDVRGQIDRSIALGFVPKSHLTPEAVREILERPR
jgi:DNA-binding NarL/FixJ family response regulator